MKAIQPEEIARIVGGELHGGSQGPITGVAIDSRNAKTGDLFVAITTQANDGHRFVPAAFANGARAAFVSRSKAREHLRDWDIYTLIVVDDPVRALQKWASEHRHQSGIPVIAVTGSNGKTTAKEFIASTLESLGPVLKTEGNLNNHLGVPMTLLRITEEHRVAVVEMGMNHSGEIRLLGQIAKPTIGVITNTGQAHLEFFPTLDALIDAKWELAETIVDKRQMVLNRDDDGLRARGASYDGPISWYGIEKPCEWHPTDLTRSNDGSWSFRVKGVSVTLRVPGHHMVGNALAALAVADLLRVPLDAAAEALSRTESVERRMRSIIVSDVLILDDAYNANPTSMKAALTTLDTLDGRHIAVLGGMRELGNSSAELHRLVGRFAAERGIHLIAVGELGKDIAAGYREIRDADVVEATTHNVAIDWMRENVKRGDAVLVKGSRSERMEVVVDALRKHLESISAV